MKKNEIYVYKYGTKDDIQQELRLRCRGFANNITDYIDSELQKVDKTLFNQWAENELLKDRIDKAIEYINNRIYYFNEMERDYMKEYFPSESREYENILDILKGSDSNE